MTSSDQIEDYSYFQENKAKFFKEYPGKFLAIKNKEILGVYDDNVTAFLETSKSHEPGTFLIQECDPDKDMPVQMFHTRVAI